MPEDAASAFQRQNPRLTAAESRRWQDGGPNTLDTDYVVVELARHLIGEDWLARYVAAANSGGIERVLL